MAKGEFSSIKRDRKKPDFEEFVGSAKVDGNKDETIKPANTRRGKYKIDPDTGERVSLGGKVLGIPLNQNELETITEAAENAGMPVATFVRAAAMKAAKDYI
ncbi:hypothetical protein [Providencia alcalifaciens]|uniref:hypothetical protein n=1 Tax=Providencia alcalifaciens TaxID=126385 RepID=UPI002B060C7D|nr:hypothetical protein [Providencia alcalifaciens]